MGRGVGPTEGPGAVWAWRSAGAWGWLLGVVAVGLWMDLGSKSLAFARVAGSAVDVRRGDVLAAGPRGLSGLIPPHPPVRAIPGLLDFTLVLNPGAVFGIGAGRRWVFVGFTVLAVGFAMWMFSAWTRARDRWAHTALGLLIAGGIGNLYDRLMLACVRDFIHPLPGVKLPGGLTWPNGSAEVWPYVSNVADLWLIVGILILVVVSWGSKGPGAVGGGGSGAGGSGAGGSGASAGA